ncbi:hypothetical protein F6W69_02770 [Microbacterium oxydans]|uniref:hypothetical protein n=1 Tax=Microbacterium oxydans TaxID=82380 RepID=UPI001144948C|nr:hypothetical protein [Microbacterium oxydans]KAB1892998.1 hypothetical protein F6W69_02770 [Microbacterium oxydans]GED37420.1 hypothetical protein MOX01_05620 [Microbacterium oxydans]
MNPHLARWDALLRLHDAATSIGGLELWLFGSALRVEDPRDIDVLIIYTDAGALRRLVAADYWELSTPPIDLIAMMPDEVAELQFLHVTLAERVSSAEPLRTND